MAVEKAPVWTFPTKPKRLGRWYGKGPADRSPVGPGPAAARRVSSAMVPVQRSAGRGTWKRTASCERKTDRSATRRTVPSVSGTHAGSRTRRRPSKGCQRRFSRSRTVRRARERGGRPDPTSLDPACHPVLVSMVRGKGFPRRAHAGCRTRCRPSKGCQRRFQGVGRPRRGSWAWGGAPRGRRSSRRDGSRRDVVSDGRQSLSSACGALRRRETAMRAAPPPSTTTAASAISAMPAPVWARLLR